MTDYADTTSGGFDKREVLEELSVPALLLPALVGAGLEANDRSKYFLALLQSARARADAPSEPFSSLHEERLAAGIADDRLDRVVEQSRRVDDDLYAIPDARAIHAELLSAIGDMLAPLNTDGAEPGSDAARLDALVAVAPEFAGDQVPGRYVDRITSGRPEDGDSLHLLVMDAHRALNRLQSELATATVDGAAVYRLGDHDRELVAAFMSGVRATAALKFEHPGLATTATRVGRRLLLQNDLGTTDAHVVVIAVEDLAVTVTYTDVHLRRLQFFESLLDRFPVQWSDTRRRRGSPRLGDHHVTTGRYEAPDPDSSPRTSAGWGPGWCSCWTGTGRGSGSPRSWAGTTRLRCSAGPPTTTAATWRSSRSAGNG